MLPKQFHHLLFSPAEIEGSLVASVPQVMVEELKRFALVLAADAIYLVVQRLRDMLSSGKDDITELETTPQSHLP